MICFVYFFSNSGCVLVHITDVKTKNCAIVNRNWKKKHKKTNDTGFNFIHQYVMFLWFELRKTCSKSHEVGLKQITVTVK